MIRFLVLALTIIALSFTSAHADAEEITLEMVASANQKKEQLLNARQDRSAAIRFLHNHISDNARFKMTVNNPTMSKAHQGQKLELTKQDYINSFIQGTNFVADYEMRIQTVGFDYDNGSGTAQSTDILTERGVMLNPADLSSTNGQHFVSRTTCKTRHKLENGSLIATGSECHTDVSFEEFI